MRLRCRHFQSYYSNHHHHHHHQESLSLPLSWIRHGRCRYASSASSSSSSSSSVVLGWHNVSGCTVAERLSTEQAWWHKVTTTTTTTTPRYGPFSILLIVGHDHHHHHYQYHTANKWQKDDALWHWKNKMEPCDLWTTVITARTYDSTSKLQQQPQQQQQDAVISLYQAFLQGLTIRQNNNNNNKRHDKPRKTLIMESKACCGIGTTGKILSLQEIQTKQEESLPKRQQTSLLSSSTSTSSSSLPWLTLDPEDDDDSGSRSSSSSSSWKWQGQGLATNTTTTWHEHWQMQRTIWPWPTTTTTTTIHQNDTTSQDEPITTLSDMFPALTVKDAVQVMETVASEMYQRQDLSSSSSFY